MTPKEKAEELFDLFDRIPRYAKRAVDTVQKLPNIQYDNIQYNNDDESQYDYWEEVKQELEKL
jgi:hypothetical protein